LPSGANAGRISLASDHNQTIYAAVGSLANGWPLQGVYVSQDNGANWTTITPTNALLRQDANTYYNLALGLSPSGRLYLGLQNNVFESNVAATAWRPFTVGSNTVGGGANPPYAQPHPDHHAFAFTSDGTVYEGDDGGVWRYTPTPIDPPVDYVGTGPNGVAVGDFDGKQGPDLAVIQTDGSLLVYANKGDGTFNVPSAVNLQSGGVQYKASAVAAADFNGDGKLDLAVVDKDQSKVLILLNDPMNPGTFQAPAVYAAGNYPAGQGPVLLVAGRFFNANRYDLAVANGIGKLYILQNNPLGQFQAPVNVANNAVLTFSLAAADLDGRNNDDIVFTNTDLSNQFVSVLLNQGNGTFAAEADYNTGSTSNPGAIGIGDFNNDTKLDLAVTTSADNNVKVFLNQANGTFPANPPSYAVGTNPQSIAVGDFNADGKLDLAVANHDSNNISVLTNKADGSGTFITPALNYALLDANGAAIPASVVAAGDFKPDNKADLAALSTEGNTVAVYLDDPQAPQSGRGTWDDLNTDGLTTHQLYSVAFSATQGAMLEGSQDNGTARTTNNNFTEPVGWNSVGPGDGGLVRYEPGSSSLAYKLTQYGNI